MLIDRPCGRWVPLMGGTPATHGVALAAAPWQRSLGSRFVRLRSRRSRPPNGCARWLPVVAIAPPWSPGGASRAGSPSTVVRRSPWVASPRRRLNRRSPARARVAWATGSLRAGKIWILLHGIILPPAAGASRSEVALAKKAGTPVASRPKRSIPSSVLVLERFALKLPERPHRRRYSAKRKADDDTT